MKLIEAQTLRNFRKDILIDHSLSKLTLHTLEGSKRTVHIEGLPKHLPGGIVIALNHFVQDPSMSVHAKWMQTFEVMGGIVQAVESIKAADSKLIWTVAEKPMTAAENNQLTMKKRIFQITDKIRKAILASAHDTVTVTYDLSGVKKFITDVHKHVQDNNIVCVFPEGRTSHALKEGQPGVGYVCLKYSIPVLPVGVHFVDNDMYVRFGSVLRPEKGTTKEEFTTIIMESIAAQLPEKLAGFYSSKE